MNRSELEILLKKLPTTYLKTLSERTMYSRNYVWLVLRGERNNSKIIAAALTLADEHQSELSHLKQKIHSL
jgi:hypothetical protein